MNERTYPELGKSNLARCLQANGIEPDLVDLESEYDDSLLPGENIALVTERLGVKTTRALLAEVSYWNAIGQECSLA